MTSDSAPRGIGPGEEWETVYTSSSVQQLPDSELTYLIEHESDFTGPCEQSSVASADIQATVDFYPNVGTAGEPYPSCELKIVLKDYGGGAERYTLSLDGCVMEAICLHWPRLKAAAESAARASARKAAEADPG